jgi:hypothetical protein
VNGPGLTALERYLASGQAVAFLGAGVSVPLYPLWDELIKLLVESASARLDEQEAVTLRMLAKQRPEAAVEIVRQQLGTPSTRCPADPARPRRQPAGHGRTARRRRERPRGMTLAITTLLTRAASVVSALPLCE